MVSEERRTEGRFVLLLPPEFDYLGGLFLPDLERARLAARVALAVARDWGARLAIDFDPGADGRTAAEAAARVARSRPRGALVLGTPRDEVGASILAAALREAGVPCAEPRLAAEASDGFLRDVEKEASRGELPGVRVPEPLGGDARAPFLVLLEGEEPIVGAGVGFRRIERDLVRVSPGRAASIPAGVERIRIVEPSEVEAQARGLIGKGGLCALALPLDGAGRDGEVERWLPSAAALVAAVGADRFRLVVARSGATGADAAAGADWAVRFGMDRPAVARFLEDLVSTQLPERAGLFFAARGFFEIGIDPFEEMYAGNALPDRNEELLRNIVP